MTKFISHILVVLLLFSCSETITKVSKVARINEKERYVNNYIDDYKVGGLKFFIFFLNNLFNKPEKKNFESVKLNKKIYGNESTIITWGGHSTILYQNNNLNILVDPIFSKRASPFSFIGPKRYTKSIFNYSNLPNIDLVAISHNHYDHLDLKTVKSLAKKFPNLLFLIPLGMTDWFKDNGLENTKEFDWWDSIVIQNTKIEFVPVQHWSKRTFFDRNKSLWGGWWFEDESKSFLHLGDTGYTKDFIDIKNKLGSPDVVAIPIGAFKPREIMERSHLDPDEAVQTFKDLDAGLAIPIHWGTFILSQEEVDEPITLLKKSLKTNSLNEETFKILKHGESIILD